MEIIDLSGNKISFSGEALSEPDSESAFHLSEHRKVPGGAQAGKYSPNRTRTRPLATEANLITAIKPTIKNEHRANIFIDDTFAFSLDLAQVVDYKLKVGKTLTEKELTDLKKASNYGKLYQRTLEWVLSRPHSVRETRDYLKKKQFEKPEYGITDEDIEKVLSTLLEKHYLDDQKFAAYYLENRFQKKGISKKRLKLELQKKGIAPEIIENAFQENPRDEAEEIKKIIAKKRLRYNDEQMLAYLMRQGFGYDLIKSVLNESNLL